jgi:Beta protein
MAHWRNEAPWTRPYVPVIRGCAAELEALAWLPDTVKQRVMPLVEIVPEGVEQAARTLAASWGATQPILLDTVHLEHDATDTRNHQLVELFERCRGTVRAIPVGGLERGIDHTAALAGVAAAQCRGAALRASPTDLWPGDRRIRQLDGWLAVVDLSPDEVDLVIDLGVVREPSHVATLLSAHEALAELPYAKEWRSVTLAAAGRPKMPSCSSRDHEDLYDRLDWRLWRMVSGGELPRAPGFGDHVTLPSGLSDPACGATIAYTTGPNWLVVKRRRLAPRADELRAASQALLARPEFAGGHHCRGCATIEEFAIGGSPGGMDGWRAAGVCHHIEASVAELTSLVG